MVSVAEKTTWQIITLLRVTLPAGQLPRRTDVPLQQFSITAYVKVREIEIFCRLYETHIRVVVEVMFQIIVNVAGAG